MYYTPLEAHLEIMVTHKLSTVRLSIFGNTITHASNGVIPHINAPDRIEQYLWSLKLCPHQI